MKNFSDHQIATYLSSEVFSLPHPHPLSINYDGEGRLSRKVTKLLTGFVYILINVLNIL